MTSVIEGPGGKTCTLLGLGSVGLYRLTEGWYRFFYILPVLHTGSFNSLAEALPLSPITLLVLRVFLKEDEDDKLRTSCDNEFHCLGPVICERKT